MTRIASTHHTIVHVHVPSQPIQITVSLTPSPLRRCAQINLPSGDITDPTAWPEVINKLKESIVAAFDGAIHEREEEVRRGEAQRLTVGWNFCTWFLLKVSGEWMGWGCGKCRGEVGVRRWEEGGDLAGEG
jgi:hypothetical protein